MIDADALRPDGSLDLEAKREVEWGLASDLQDLDPAPEMDRAADLRAKSQRLVGLTAFFIAAALFFTLAEVSRNRRVEVLYWHGGAGGAGGVGGAADRGGGAVIDPDEDVPPRLEAPPDESRRPARRVVRAPGSACSGGWRCSSWW